MMKFDVVTIFPEMLDAIIDFGITRQACDRGQLAVECWNPRDFTLDQHRMIDDRPYGGGPGMVMKPEPLARCLDAVQARYSVPCGENEVKEKRQTSPKKHVIYLSPQGQRFDQSKAEKLARLPGLVLLCGRYEGIDERVLETRVDEEISIGDYVLAGGELAAMVVIEAVARLLPGVLGNALSAAQDSFSEGILDCPHYTRPEVFESMAVPDVLMSGDHMKIAQWRREAALARTKRRRPDLLDRLVDDD